MQRIGITWAVLAALVLSGCTTTTPDDQHRIAHIVRRSIELVDTAKDRSLTLTEWAEVVELVTEARAIAERAFGGEFDPDTAFGTAVQVLLELEKQEPDEVRSGA